jgi:multiple sugar transport system substrate-binding protein
MEYVGMTQSGQQRVSQLIQAGTPPEIMQTAADEAATFRNQGVIVPVTDVVENIIEEIGELREKSRFVVDGEDWMVPAWTLTPTWYYRDDITDIVPDTWDKALQYAEEADGQNGLNGTYIPITPDGVTTELPSLMSTQGGKIAEWNNGKLELAYDSGEDRQKMINALEWRQQMYEYSPDTAGDGLGDWSGAIPTGVAATHAYIGFRPVLKSWRQEREYAEHVRPIPGGGYPQAEGGSHTAAGGSAISYSVFQNSNVEAAKAWIEYAFLNQYINLSGVLNPGHYAPSFREVQQSEEYMNEIQGQFEDNGWDISEDVVRTYQNGPGHAKTFETDPPNRFAGITYASDPFTNMGAETLIQGTDPEDAIDKYAPEHQALIDEEQA